MKNIIDGVKIKKLVAHKDIPDVEDSKIKPGFLMEILRDDDKMLSHFGQSTMSVAYKGTIKAFHYHEKQDDVWFIATGNVKVVMHDLRASSLTKGKTQTLELGENNRKIVLIPKGIAHGYKVISKEPVALFYHTSKSYNPKSPDEKRLPWDFLGKEIWE